MVEEADIIKLVREFSILKIFAFGPIFLYILQLISLDLLNRYLSFMCLNNIS